MKNLNGVLGKMSRTLLIAGLVTTTFALLLGYFGNVSPIFDVLSHLRVHLILFATVAGLALCFRSHSIQILTAGMIATVLSHSWLSSGVYSTDAATPDFRVLSANTWSRAHNAQALKREIIRVDPDVVLLQEFSAHKHPLKQELKTTYPYQVSCGAGCSLAVLSKHEIRSSQQQSRSFGKVRFISVKISLNTRDVTIFGVHLANPTYRPNQQAAAIVDLVSRIKVTRGPIVLAGDLNATPWSAAFRRIKEGANLTKVPGIRPSWPGLFLLPPQLAIDHFLTSDDVTTTKSWIGNRIGSDHLPIVGEFQIKR